MQTYNLHVTLVISESDLLLLRADVTPTEGHDKAKSWQGNVSICMLRLGKLYVRCFYPFWLVGVRHDVDRGI